MFSHSLSDGRTDVDADAFLVSRPWYFIQMVSYLDFSRI